MELAKHYCLVRESSCFITEDSLCSHSACTYLFLIQKHMNRTFSSKSLELFSSKIQQDSGGKEEL